MLSARLCFLIERFFSPAVLLFLFFFKFKRYYDTFLLKYQELTKEKGWKQPLLVALSYSAQIMEEGVIPVNSTDVPIDALVSSSGVIPISPAALERMK
jgi:5-formyltetrahydrofolate cyclo-ligase